LRRENIYYSRVLGKTKGYPGKTKGYLGKTKGYPGKTKNPRNAKIETEKTSVV